jgi:CDP-glycerol glycerophosphotransferase (TagB/SpsB family)
VLRERLRRVARRRRTRPSVVVVLGPGQEGGLADCLASVPPYAESVVAAWGGAVGDQPVDASGGDLPEVLTANEARNAGAAAATGDTVTFLDATETLRDGALDALLADLGDADVVVGRGPVTSLAHVLWRRGAVPRFDPAHGRFGQAALPTRAATSDVLAAEVGDLFPGPFGTVPSTAGELGALAAVLEAAPQHATALLDAVGPVFLDDLEHAGKTDVAAFAAALADDAVLAVADVETRVRLWLVAHGHAAAMSRLNAERWYVRGQFPTDVVDGTVRARIDVDVPPEVLAVPATFEASLRRVVAEDGLLRLTVFAAVRYVDFAAHPPTVEARMVHEGGDSVPLAVTPEPDPAASRHWKQSYQDHAEGAVRIDLDPSRLARDGRWHFELSLAVEGLHWSGRVLDRDERSSAGDPPQPTTVKARLAFDRTHGVQVLVGVPAPPRREDLGVPRADEVEVKDTLIVRGTAPADLTVELVVGGRRLPGEVTRDAGRFTARFPLLDDPWGLGATALPTGTAHVAWRSGRSHGELAIAPALVAATPHEVAAPEHRVTVLRGRRGQLLVRLQPPLADDELGPLAQQRLRAAYALDERPVDPGLVVANCYAGTGSTDSPRAIVEELAARRPGLRLLWTVADHAVAVPAGTEPVLLRSRAWYDALATAGLVVSNVEMDRFFRTRPGQRLLQTFHGYPAKAMGLGLWRSKNFSPERLEQQLLQTSRQWSVILTPSPEMNDHYREQYDYTGPILDRGYPRDDVLIGPGAAERRAEARRRLGLAEHQVAVLYAPTWRDDVATNFRAAPMVAHLDVRRAAAALGPDHVMLLRGHRFHDAPGEGDRVRDVTSYPEINDLVLAADAAVLDYSSLRFDFALTGRPMVFLVPDLEEYAGANRGFLFPFTDSAPGPLAATTDEVVELLRDLPALSTAWAPALVRFNATYNAHQDGRATARVVDHLVATGPSAWDTLSG